MAQSVLDRKPASVVHYAAYRAPDGTVLYGTATYCHEVEGFLFVDDNGADPLYTCYGALTFPAAQGRAHA